MFVRPGRKGAHMKERTIIESLYKRPNRIIHG